jgi:hypothetical protein
MFLELQAKDYFRYENLSLEAKAGIRVQVELVSNRYEYGFPSPTGEEISRDVFGQVT